MRTTEETDDLIRDLAAARLDEVDTLSRQIRENLKQMIDEWDTSTGAIPKSILDKLNLLHAAHLMVIKAEDAFHDKIKHAPDAEAIDLDAIRSDVGRRLDRLRETLLAEGFPCDPVTRAACNAALPLRLLGDAASDSAQG